MYFQVIFVSFILGLSFSPSISDIPKAQPIEQSDAEFEQEIPINNTRASECSEVHVRTVIIASDVHYGGERRWRKIDMNCRNIPHKMIARGMGSIDTRGSCVTMHEEPGCQGMQHSIRRHSHKATDLGSHGIIPKSMRLCGPTDTARTIFYSGRNLKGKSEVVEHQLMGHCMNLKKIANEVSSLEVEDECIVVFTDSDCTGRALRIAGSSKTRDLRLLGFDNDIESSRLCSVEDQGQMTYVILLPQSMGIGSNMKALKMDTPIENAEQQEKPSSTEF